MNTTTLFKKEVKIPEVIGKSYNIQFSVAGLNFKVILSAIESNLPFNVINARIVLNKNLSKAFDVRSDVLTEKPGKIEALLLAELLSNKASRDIMELI